MAKTLKVYAGLSFVNDKAVRTIVATATKRKALELLDEKPYYFNLYWEISRNETELDVALNHPNTVFVASSSGGFDFIERPGI